MNPTLISIYAPPLTIYALLTCVNVNQASSRLQSLNFGLQKLDFRVWTSDFDRLWTYFETSDIGLRILCFIPSFSDFGLISYRLWTDFILRILDFRLRTDFRLQTLDFGLQTSDFGLGPDCKHQTSDFGFGL